MVMGVMSAMHNKNNNLQAGFKNNLLFYLAVKYVDNMGKTF